MSEFAPEVEAHIRSYCGWHIAPAVTETFTFYATGAHALILPTLKINEVLSVTEGGAEVPIDALIVRSEAGILWRADGWLRSPIVVQVNHGYDEFPAELADAITRFAAAPRVPAGASVRVGSVSVSGGSAGGSGLDFFSDSVLDRYRIRHAS